MSFESAGLACQCCRGAIDYEHGRLTATTGGSARTSIERNRFRRRCVDWPERNFTRLFVGRCVRPDRCSGRRGRTRHSARFIHSHVADRECLLLSQSRRFRLRDDLLVGHSGHGPMVGLDGRMGHRDDRNLGCRFLSRCWSSIPFAHGGAR